MVLRYDNMSSSAFHRRRPSRRVVRSLSLRSFSALDCAKLSAGVVGAYLEVFMVLDPGAIARRQTEGTVGVLAAN